MLVMVYRTVREATNVSKDSSQQVCPKIFCEKKVMPVHPKH